MDLPNQSDKKSDAQVEMLQQFQKIQFENETLKTECDRLQKLLDEITCSNDSQRICECGRKLRYISTETEYKGNKCTKCSQTLSEVSSVWWSCQECKYHVCIRCEGYKKSVCPFSHFLQFKKINADIEHQEEQNEEVAILQRLKSKGKRECDICRKQIGANYYTCTCGFDMCNQCRCK